MMMRSILFLFNKYFGIAIIFLLIQQIIVASSTYFISDIARKISLQQDFVLSLILFICSLVFVYIPGSLSLFFLEKSKMVSVKKYINELFKIFFNQVTYRNSQQKNDILPLVSSEAFIIFSEGAEFSYEFMAVLFNLLANIIVLSFVIDSDILYFYLLGMFLSICIVILTNKNILDKSKIAQENINHTKGIIYQFWDNVTLGNHYNYSIYKDILNKSYTLALRTRLRSVLYNNITSNLGMIVMMLPVAYYTLNYFYLNSDNWEILAVIAATLPRQIIMMQYAYSAIGQSINFLGLYSRFKILNKYFERIEDNASIILERVNFPLLNVSYNNAEFDISDLVKNKLPSKGRITIRGNNGSGKSSLLYYLKLKNPNDTFYFPANSHLFFNSTLDKPLSTGQTISYALDEIMKDNSQTMKIIMLDEWDANLDLIMIERLERHIYEISKEKLIIEIRHR